MDQQSDEELLRHARSGSRAAWAELFERHQGGIYRFTRQMSGSHAIADEVVQERSSTCCAAAYATIRRRARYGCSCLAWRG